MTKAAPWAAGAAALLAAFCGLYLWRRRRGASPRTLWRDAGVRLRGARRKISVALRKGARRAPWVARRMP